MSFSPRLPNAPSQYDRVNEAQFRAQLRQAIQDLSSPSGTSLDLDDLDDVNVPGPSDDDVLMWSTDRWVAFALFTENLTFEGNLTVNGTLTLVGDVTAANVDFSGNVTFTGATTVPEATVTEHEAALSIAFSQLTGQIAEAQIPASAIAEGDVTQHEAALTIAESQITDGSILARLAAAETVTGAWTFSNLLKVSRGSDEQARLDHSSSTGNPFLTFYQDGNRRAYIRFEHTTDEFQIKNEAGHIAIDNDAGGDEILRLRHTGTGSPFISLYQAGSRVGFLQFLNSSSRIRIRNEATGSPEWSFEDGGDFVAEDGDVIATVP